MMQPHQTPIVTRDAEVAVVPPEHPTQPFVLYRQWPVHHPPDTSIAVISELYHAASASAAYASRDTLPCPMQGSLPADWLAFAGWESNPLDSIEKFQLLT